MLFRSASIRNPHVAGVLAGCAAGAVLSLACLQWLISLGTGVAAWLTLGLAALAGLASGLMAPLPTQLDRRRVCGAAGVLALVLVCGLSTTLVSAVLDWLWSPTRISAEMSAATFGWLCCAAGLLAGVPTALATWVLRSASGQPTARLEPLPLAGAALGMVAHGGVFAPWWGLSTGGLWLCALMLPGVAWIAWRCRGITGELLDNESTGGDLPLWNMVAAVAACLGAGITLVAQQELWAHLAPVTADKIGRAHV